MPAVLQRKLDQKTHHSKWLNQGCRYLLLLASLLLASSLLGCSLLDKTYYSNEAENYESFISMYSGMNRFMPKADDLGNYKSVVFGYKEHIISMFMGFHTDGVSVFVSYDRNNYESEKEKAFARYEFLSEPVIDSSGYYTIPVVSFEYKGYTFRIISQSYYYPKQFTMVGVNDKKATIAYLAFYDDELDYLSEENAGEAERIKCMQNLVRTSFVWE